MNGGWHSEICELMNRNAVKILKSFKKPENARSFLGLCQDTILQVNIVKDGKTLTLDEIDDESVSVFAAEIYNRLRKEFFAH